MDLIYLKEEARQIFVSGEMPVSLPDAAISYARAGIPVFPCEDKEPLTPNGFKDATTDLNQVRRWWQRYPQANIGVPTGTVSGLLIIDVDLKDGRDGYATIRRLVEKYGPFIAFTIVRTGSGTGVHLYFLCPVPVRSRDLGDGLELKADGRYVILPPSTGAKCPYEFIRCDGLSEPPTWLLEDVREPKRAATDARSGGEPVDVGGNDPIPHGKRNRTLFRIGSSLRGQGYEYAAIAATLEEINASRCDPPIGTLPDDKPDELQKIAWKVSEYPAGSNGPGDGERLKRGLRDEVKEWKAMLRNIKWENPSDEAGAYAVAEFAVLGKLVGEVARFNVSTRQIAARAGIPQKTAARVMRRLVDEYGILDREPYTAGRKKARKNPIFTLVTHTTPEVTSVTHTYTIRGGEEKKVLEQTRARAREQQPETEKEKE